MKNIHNVEAVYVEMEGALNVRGMGCLINHNIKSTDINDDVFDVCDTIIVKREDNTFAIFQCYYTSVWDEWEKVYHNNRQNIVIISERCNLSKGIIGKYEDLLNDPYLSFDYLIKTNNTGYL